MGEFLSTARAWLNQDLIRIGDTPISVSTVITLLLIFLLTLRISVWLRRLTLRLLSKRNPAAASTLAALIHYAVLIVGFSTALSTAGINLTGLFAAGAIFAVGLGFAMQSIVQNFVSGVILLIERSIKPGDILEVEGTIVKVADMGIRASLVQSRDGEDIIIPNSVLAQNSVKNFTMRDSDYRVRALVGVTYSSDMKVVRKTLEEVAAEIRERWQETAKEPSILMRGFGDNSVNWEVGVWTSAPWTARVATSELHEAVWQAFLDKGIVIAFPQLDVHLDTAVVDAWSGKRQAAR